MKLSSFLLLFGHYESFSHIFNLLTYSYSHPQDSSVDEILEFLDKAEAAGQNITTVIGPQVRIVEWVGNKLLS